MPPEITQILKEGQDAIFLILEELRKDVREIAVQKNEILHINKALASLEKTDDDHEQRLSEVETKCLRRHAAEDLEKGKPTPEKTFGQRLLEGCVYTVVIGAVCILCSILGFTLFVNTPPFFDFQRTQIEKKTSFPASKHGQDAASH